MKKKMFDSFLIDFWSKYILCIYENIKMKNIMHSSKNE
jgi:hypothetical protein